MGFYDLSFLRNYGGKIKENDVRRARVTHTWNCICTYNILSWKKKEKNTLKSLYK
jgi:hypothetical protein